MPRVSPILTNFTAGEFSPQMYGRVDLAQYVNGCRKLRNFIVRVHGGAQRRPGTYFVSEVKDSTAKTRLIPFKFYTIQTYVIEVGNLYMRFYKDQGQIQLSYSAWVAATPYAIGALTTNGGSHYRCLKNHTSTSTFATDLAAGDWVASGGAADLAYEIVTAYVTADIPLLRFIQDKDIMYIFHPSYPPRKLTRTGHTAWTLTTVTFIDGPYQPENSVVDVGANLCPDGDMEENTGEASVGTPTTQERSADRAYSGAYSRKFIVDAVGEGFKMGVFTSTINKIYRLRFRIYTSAGNISFSVRKGDDSGFIFTDNISSVPQSEWTEYERFYKETAGGAGAYVQFVNATGTSGTFYIDKVEIFEVVTTLITPSAISGAGITLTASTALFVATHVGALFRLRYGELSGYVQITAYSSSTSVTVEAMSPLADIIPTAYWREGSWSAKNGYPACGAFYEQRMICGYTTNDPDTLWGSKPTEYENFTPGALDTDPIGYKLQANIIRWLSPLSQLMIGAVETELRLGSPNSDTPITPSTVKITPQSSKGSANIESINVGNAVIFAQRHGIASNYARRLRELAYNFNSIAYTYDGVDLTLFAEHITGTGIVEMAYMSGPYPIIWAVTADGVLIGLTYEKDQKVLGWHQHPMDGLGESLCVIPGQYQDELWILVKRTINGSAKRYVEFMTDFDWGTDQTDCFFVDCGLTYDGSATTTLTGLSHLEKKTVAILADGAVHPAKVVSSGSITLDYAASVVQVGLPYTSDLETLDLEGGSVEGTAQGKIKRIHTVGVRFIDTLGGFVGPDENSLEPIIFRVTNDDVGEPVPLFDGIKDVAFPGGWEMERRILVRQADPLPMTVLSIMPRFRTEDK